MRNNQIKSLAETLENAPDRYVAIREALNMGPTPGPWSFKDNRDGSINLFGDGRLFSPSCRLMNKPANEAYISACDPDTIRELLAERDALAAENERLRKALEPFALVAEHDISEDETDNDTYRPMPKPFNHAPQITVGHLRAALAVVREAK